MKNLSNEIGNRKTKTSEGIIYSSNYTMIKKKGDKENGSFNY